MMNFTPRRRSLLAFCLLVTAALLRVPRLHSQDQPAPPPDPPTSPATRPFTLKIDSDLVLTNVIVRDTKTGEPVRGLTQDDFTILEAGKPQRISSFDFESVDAAAQLNEKTISGTQSSSGLLAKGAVADASALRNHRLIVMFFDLTSMQVEDIDRSVQAAKDYVNQKMQPADLVALVSLGTGLTLDQDFTADKTLLLRGVGKYNGTQGAGFANGTTSSDATTVEDASSATPDESEYNNINTDRKLYAIQSIAQSLSAVQERKSMLYFSGGLTRTGIENQAALRAATNAAVRANLAIYSVDSRGLQALPPVGDAQTGSLRGTSAYSGGAVQAQLDSNFSSQEVLATLSADTGGKSFFDSNDFSPAFLRIQQDTSAYYVLGFRSTNPVRDGKFRKLTVRLNSKRPNLKIEYRPGYYAPADFQHSGKEDRERQLDDELASDLPSTDVAVYLQALYFRTGDGRFFVPVSLIVPGSQIPFIRIPFVHGKNAADKDKATLDVIGSVKEVTGRQPGMQVGQVRDTVRLALDATQQVQRKNIQYSTGFTLPPGTFRLKFVVRENETGRMGSFEADITVPDFKRTPLKLSSVVLSSQRVANTSKPSGRREQSPLIRDGLEWIPNVPHVFRTDQHLYFLYEVYDPARASANSADKTASAAVPPQTTQSDGAAAPPQKSAKSKSAGAQSGAPGQPVNVLTSIEFLSGSTKVYETPLISATRLNLADRGAVAFQFDVPLDQLKPGPYTVQVNVIDDTAGAFTFPRVAILVREPAAATPPATTPTTAAATPSTR